MITNKTRKKIPSLRLSEKLIHELCNFFTKEEISYDDKIITHVEYNFDLLKKLQNLYPIPPIHPIPPYILYLLDALLSSSISSSKDILDLYFVS